MERQSGGRCWTRASAEQARKVAAARYPFLLPEEDMDVRYFFVDGEDMAEGGVEEQLRRMAPALAVFGVQLTVELVDLRTPSTVTTSSPSTGAAVASGGR